MAGFKTTAGELQRFLNIVVIIKIYNHYNFEIFQIQFLLCQKKLDRHNLLLLMKF